MSDLTNAVAKLDPTLFFRTEADAEPYSPAGHTGTVNRRLVSPETGATQMEVLIGRIEPGQGATPHFHPGRTWQARKCAPTPVPWNCRFRRWGPHPFA